MQESIYLRFIDADPDRVRWQQPDGGAGSGTPEDASLDCEGRRVVLLAPADQVLLMQARVPARNRQRALQALPYLLEDRLVQDIEQMHFAVGTRDPDGLTSVAVVERARLERWLERLRSAGIDPDAVIPETLAVPLEDNAWTVLQDGAITLVRTGTQSGFAIDSDNASKVLSALFEDPDTTQPQRLVVYIDEHSKRNEFYAGLGCEFEIRNEAEDTLARLARNADERSAIDLLQGDYNRSEQLGRLYRPWFASAALLSILLVFYTGLLSYEYLRLSGESDLLRTQIENSYREAFPDANRVVNPRVQMERGLASLRSGGGGSAGDFLDMMRQVAPTLGEVEGIELQRVNYRDRQLDFALTIPDLQNLDRLKQEIGGDSPLEVEIQSASAVGERVEARIQVRSAQ